MRIIFEIGANIGSDTAVFARDSLVYAFEPEPKLFENLKTMFKDSQNVKLFDYAIDLENGVKQFHSSDLETGIGSLYQLHPDLLKTELDRYECFRQGFHNTYDVKTIRMDTIVEQEKVEHIDFLWIDAQGNDFNVIKSFGEKLSIVQAGRCECTFQIPLYEGVDNYHENVKAYLEANGFNVEVDYIHQHNSEIDLNFWR